MSEPCKVHFSIGKYRDKVYHDVLDMDACHLLFRRPWQFDSDVWHSGRDNVYRLEKDRVRFTLFPLMNGSRPKVKHKLGVQNNVVDDLKGHDNLLLLQKNEIIRVDQLKNQDSKFLGRICIQMFQQTRGRVFLKWEGLMRAI